MKASLRLAKALLRVAQEIERCPEDYNWGDPTACNVGKLALKLGAKKKHIINSGIDSFSEASRFHDGADVENYYDKCFTSVLDTLYAAGLDDNDIAEIESIQDKALSKAVVMEEIIATEDINLFIEKINAFIAKESAHYFKEKGIAMFAQMKVLYR